MTPEAVGFAWRVAWCLGLLADLALDDRDAAGALALRQEGLGLFRQLGAPYYPAVDCP